MSTPLEETLFQAARELRDPAARAAFLAQECGSDDALRGRIEALLQANPASTLNDSGVEAVVATGRPAALEKAGETIDRYKLLQQIGEGGYGVVYMAEQSEPVRRKVALKVIKVGMDTKSVIARFDAERQALAMMDHPNIAKVLDAGATAAGRPYFVMELVRGIPITKYCDQNNLPAPERLDLFIAVCHAIQHAHQKGIIHRDIKPSNILVTLHDGVPVPKVIDFGIAKATEARLTDLTLFTELHAFIGTPAYTSPEQAEMSGLDIDTRSDIYSLGVLLYELLSGRLPFDPEKLLRAGLDEMRRTIREVEPPRPSTRLSTLTDAERTAIAKQRGLEPGQLSTLLRGDLDWIVMKTLEKDRTRRYDTANGLALDLQRYLGNEPVLARPPSATYLLRKLVRRHRAAFAAGSAVLVALIAGIAVSSWQAVRATRAERAIGEERTTAVTERDRARQAKREATEAAQEAKNQRLLAEHQLSANLYATSMNLAQAAWDQANIIRLREILEETRSYPDRGFEWYYWQRQTHLELRTLRGHEASVLSVAFSRDGQQIATGSDDKTAKVWEAETGRLLLTLRAHTKAVNAVAFSFDGRRIATGSDDGTAKLWDAETGRELLTLERHAAAVPPFPRRSTTSLPPFITPERYAAAVSSVAFSPDGRKIVTGSDDKTARVWDANNGRELLALKGGAGALSAVVVSAVAVSWDGQRIVTGSPDTAIFYKTKGKKFRTVRDVMIWDTRAAALVDDRVYDVVNKTHKFSLPEGMPDSRRVAPDTDKAAVIWDAETGRELFALKGHTGTVSSVTISPDARQIVTGSDQGMIKVWDAEGREMLTIERQADSILALAISPYSQRIVAGSGGKTAKVWDVRTGRELFTFKGHTGDVSSLAISSGDRRIVTGSDDGTARIWDAETGRDLVNLEGLANASPCVISVAFSPDGRRITARILDADKSGGLLSLKRKTSPAHSGAFSPDGRRMVTGSDDGTARIWDTETGRDLLTVKRFAKAVSSMALSPDARRIVTGSPDGTANVWNAEAGRALSTLQGHTGVVTSAAFSSDGRRIVTVSSDGAAKIWDVETGRELLTLKGHTGDISSLTISHDGRQILTGGFDNMARVWNADNGRELLSLEGHAGAVSSVAISTDGHRIATGSQDGKVKVWDAETGRDLLTLKPQAEWGVHVSFASNVPGQQTNEVTWYGPDNVWTIASPEEVEAWQKEGAADEKNRALHAIMGDLDSAIEEQDWERANLKLTAAETLASEDQRTVLDLKRFDILIGSHDYSDAWKLAGKISAGHQDDADLQNSLAREIATTEGIEARWLEMAERFATRANDITKGKDPDILDTLARVLFMRGKEAEAIHIQEQAVTLAKDTKMVELQTTLESYRKGILPK